MHKFIISLITLTIFLGGCMNQAEKSKEKDEKNKKSKISNIVLTDSLKSTLIKRGDNIAKHAQAAFQTALKKAIKSKGLAFAIGFCNTEAMVIADSVSKDHKAHIRRISKKNRNPLNATNEAESEIYKTYILEWINGAVLQARIIPNEKGHPVYYRPIGMQAVCLNCHGVPGEDIPSPMRERIEKMYPDDKAINFKNGELRGMWAIEFQEYTVQKDN